MRHLHHTDHHFPPPFHFGLATAPAHSEDHLDDAWLAFAQQGHVKAWRNTPRPRERLRAYTEPRVDIDLAIATGISLYRTGVDWGRLVPNCSLDADDASRCAIQDERALAQYARTLGYVKSRGLKVMLTLFHHSFPKWGVYPQRSVREPGAAAVGEFGPGGAATGLMWHHPNAVKLFITFAADVERRLGHLVDYWVVFNEPVVFTTLTHCLGIWPPGPRVDDVAVQLNCITNRNTGALRAQIQMARAHRGFV